MKVFVLSAFFTATLGLTNPNASAAPANETDRCVYTVTAFAALPDGKSDLLLIGSTEPFVGDLRLRMWSATKTYAVDLPHFAIDRPPASLDLTETIAAPQPTAVNAPLQVVELPDRDELQAMRLEPTDSRELTVPTCRGAGAVSFPIQFAMHGSDVGRDKRLQAELLRHATSIEGSGIAVPDGVTIPPLTCARPFADAHLVVPQFPHYPIDAQLAGARGTSEVRVRLATDGQVVKTWLFKSSGRADLDNAAQTAASRSTYEAEVFRCEPQVGDYLFRVDFSQ